MHNIDTHTGASFSLINRVSRFIWAIVYILFFRYSPRPFHEWRSFLLRVFGAKVGRGVHVYPSVKIWAPWNLELDDQCGIGDQVDLYSQAKIRIGYRAIVSQRSYLCTGTHDYTHPGHPLFALPIVIGSNVWVAAEVFVHPGICIEEGAVVGARSVVTKNQPAWMICSGNPCKPIKKRELVDLSGKS